MNQASWRIFDDPAAFVEALGPMYLELEIRNCLPLSICRRLADAGGDDRETLLYAARDGDVIAGAAVRTPERNIVPFSGPRWDREDLLMLCDALISAGVDLPGVMGPASLARAFATAWCDRRQTAPVVKMELGLYGLTEVRLEPGPGSLEKALPGDSEFFWEWEKSFCIDCFGELQPHVTREASERLLASGEVHFWKVDGERVSMAASGRNTGRGAIVNLVYTPPARRGRGYASSIVSALSRRQLDSGLDYCTLFTDISNPVSNSIYRRIGYEYAGGFTEIAFLNGG